MQALMATWEGSQPTCLTCMVMVVGHSQANCPRKRNNQNKGKSYAEIAQSAVGTSSPSEKEPYTPTTTTAPELTKEYESVKSYQ
jgi:hypothetical protein